MSEDLQPDHITSWREAACAEPTFGDEDAKSGSTASPSIPTSEEPSIRSWSGISESPPTSEDAASAPCPRLDQHEQFAGIKPRLMALVSALLDGGSVTVTDGDQPIEKALLAIYQKVHSGIQDIPRPAPPPPARVALPQVVPVECHHDPEGAPCVVAEQYVGHLPDFTRQLTLAAGRWNRTSPQDIWCYPCNNCPRLLDLRVARISGKRLGRVERDILLRAGEFDRARITQEDTELRDEPTGTRVVVAGSGPRAETNAAYRARENLRLLGLIRTIDRRIPGVGPWGRREGGYAILTEYGQRIADAFRKNLEEGKPIRWGATPAKAAEAVSLSREGLLRIWIESIVAFDETPGREYVSYFSLGRCEELGWSAWRIFHSFPVLIAAATARPDLADTVRPVLSHYAEAVKKGFGFDLALPVPGRNSP
jgi:hypothetical protein